MAKYQYRFFFDVDGFLWGNGQINDRYSDPISLTEIDDLPISDDLKNEIKTLMDQFDNIDDYLFSEKWAERNREEFIKEVRNAYQKLCDELGSDYEIKYEFDVDNQEIVNEQNDEK